ncbi:alcohol dehydrogenase catalytic domain-containing protein [Halomonas caseinilytica]|uniref:alcohol dehydrogenase catalytic domain-containing protein n=1 Tax=Halomonas caseinilytica TaxID=438744 RepID=UPI0008483F0B|nr:alcohol dehydrogenase catalytic domain-containing protein [Halomonas caseinilytica]
MSQTMQAIVNHGPYDYRLERVDIPRPQGSELVIRVEACGICASDVKCWSGADMFWGNDEQPAYVEGPVIPGHEFVGRITEVGPDHTRFAIGDRVIAEQIVPCEACDYCERGQYWMCERHHIFGFQDSVNGGMAEYMRFPENARLHTVPDDLPLDKAVLIEPFACSMHAVERADIQLDDTVVISGAGTLGLGMVGIAKLKSPRKLIVLDMNDDRLARAEAFGADLTLNPTRDDVVARILAETRGYGCDVYIEASGAPASVRQGLNAIRKLGRFVEFSVFGEPVLADWSIIGDRKELDLLGAHLGPYCYPATIEGIASGAIPTNGLVTHRLPLSEFEQGFKMVKEGKDTLKVVLIPGTDAS